VHFVKIAIIGLLAGLAAADLALAGADGKEEDHLKEDRERMVAEQIISRGVRNEKVLTAMRKVKRHEFVPAELLPYAYEDGPLPIGEEQTISQPYIVAYMTELLDLKGNEKILEIGTGSGYQAAVLAELVKEVYTIEIVKPLYEQAKTRLEGMGYKNIHCKLGDGFLGWPEAAPFDAVIITCAVEPIPPPLIEQLREGGKLVAPEGSWYQELVILTKTKKGLKKEKTLPVRFVPLVREKKHSS
jgi:protein-L-isoaspartate(D-aspartate) O-methyltransferase